MESQTKSRLESSHLDPGIPAAGSDAGGQNYRSPENRSDSRPRTGYLLVAKPEGRLGNQLFAFSHLIAYALDNGYQLLNPSFYHYGHFFRGTCHDPLCRVPQLRQKFAPRLAFIITGWLAKHFYSLVKRLPSLFTLIDSMGHITDLGDHSIKRHVEAKKPLILYGWSFRYKTCVHLYEHDIRNYFRPIEKHQLAIDHLHENIRRSCGILIGVHIRRGDFRHFHDGRLMRSNEIFSATMEGVQKLFPGRKVAFLICSDEKVDPAAFGKLDIHIGTGHIIEDLYALAGADYLIGTPSSTFSMWASFYGKTPLYTLDDVGQRPTLNSFRVVCLGDV